MKTSIKLAVLASITLLCIAGCGDCTGGERPVGEWIAQDNREAIVFRNDGNFEVLSYRADYYPAPQFPGGPGVPTGEGTPIPNSWKWRLTDKGTYTTDFSKNPAWVDLISTKSTPRRMQGLMQFLDDNTMYLAIDEVRPATIDRSQRGKIRLTRAAKGEIKR